MSELIVCPIQIVQDQLLTAEEIRVLLALFSFRTPESDVYWPPFESLARLCGCDQKQLSSIVSGLAEKGWLSSRGNNEYQAFVPDRLYAK